MLWKFPTAYKINPLRYIKLSEVKEIGLIILQKGHARAMCGLKLLYNREKENWRADWWQIGLGAGIKGNYQYFVKRKLNKIFRECFLDSWSLLFKVEEQVQNDLG